MAVYISDRGRRQLDRPTHVLGLDRDSPLCSGLIRAYVPNVSGSPLIREIARDGKAPTVEGAPASVGSALFGGTVRRYDGSSALDWWSHDVFFGAANAFTLAIIFRTTYTSPNNVLFGLGSSASTGPLIGLTNGPSDYHKIRCIARNTAGDTNDVQAATGDISDGAWHWATATVPATPGVLQRVFLDGVSVGLDTSAATFTSETSFNQAAVGGLRRIASSSWYAMDVAGAFIWNRFLTFGDIWALYDPATRWDIFAKPSRRVYFGISTATFNPAWARNANHLITGVV